MRVPASPSQPRTYLRSEGIFFKIKAHLVLLNDDYYNYFSDTCLIDKYFRFIAVCFADIRDFLGKEKARGPRQARYNTVLKYNTHGGYLRACARHSARQAECVVLVEILFKSLPDRAAFFNGGSERSKGKCSPALIFFHIFTNPSSIRTKYCTINTKAECRA